VTNELNPRQWDRVMSAYALLRDALPGSRIITREWEMERAELRIAIIIPDFHGEGFSLGSVRPSDGSPTRPTRPAVVNGGPALDGGSAS
jgi:hypothetical protein